MYRVTTIKQNLLFLFLPALALIITSCGYLQINPPPDVKADELPEDQSAWLAAASNMLAAAGYGYGQDAQVRAEKIFQHLVEHFGKEDEGWTDAALQWWLGSDNNEWPENPYKQVTIIGNKTPPLPWSDPAGSAKIGNLLREGQIVSASISWPSPEVPGKSAGGHVLNCWGDDRGEKKNEALLPSHLRVTDCYRNRGGIIQTYEYDDFSTNLPDGIERKGWYISYDHNHPFIKHIILLSKVSYPEAGNQACVNRIMIDRINTLSTRADMLSVKHLLEEGTLSHHSKVILPKKQIIPNKNDSNDSYQRTVTNEWGFNRNDLEKGESFTLLMSSSGKWDRWTGLGEGYLTEKQKREKMPIPGFSYRLQGTEVGKRHLSSSFTGGYYLLSLTFVVRDTLAPDSLGYFEVLIMHQYPAGAHPEKPILQITADRGYSLKEIKAGHSYSSLDPAEQNNFSKWLVNRKTDHLFTGDTVVYNLNIIGLLPYPGGENYSKRIPE